MPLTPKLEKPQKEKQCHLEKLGQQYSSKLELQNMKFRGNPSLPSEESDTDPDMEETRATGGNHPLTKLEVLM